MRPVSGGLQTRTDDTDAPAAPAPGRPHRRRRTVVVLAVVFVLAYAGLLWLYAISGRTSGVTAPPVPPKGGVYVDARVEKIDGAARRLTVGIDIAPDRSLLDPS